MTNEDTLQKEAKLRSRGFIKCFSRQKYLLKERIIGGVLVARMIISYTEKLAKKDENTEMMINFGNDKFKWVHPDEYAEKRYAYATSQPEFEAPEPVIEEEVVEDSTPTDIATEEFIADTVTLESYESVEDVFKGMNVDEMRKLCKTKYKYKLPKTIQKRESAIRTIKKHLED